MAKAKKSRKGKEVSKGQAIKTAIAQQICQLGINGPLTLKKVRELISNGIDQMAEIPGYKKSYSQAYKKMDFEIYILHRLYEVIFTIDGVDFEKLEACLDPTFEPHADLVAESKAQTPEPKHEFDLSGLTD